MMPWAEVAAEGPHIVDAANALATSLGATDAMNITNMVCTRNETSGVWTCIVLKFTAP